MIAAVLLARGRFDRTRAVGLMTVLLLAALYPQREVLADPISAALQLAPVALLIFGISWRVLTEAQVTQGESARYPQSTRILLFLANIMLATTGIAWVTLTRAAGTTADVSDWAFVGDSFLGEPLFYAGLVSGVWLMVRPTNGPGPAIVGDPGAPAAENATPVGSIDFQG